MKVPAYCPACLEVHLRRASLHLVGADDAARRPDVEQLPVTHGQLRSPPHKSGRGRGFVLHLRCQAGHEVEIESQALAHEALFELGCYALLDGYFREALLDFAAAFERFQDFASRLLLHLSSEASSKVEEWHKAVRKHSERVLGAYLALWTRHFGETPPMLSKAHVELRNECAHAGHFPDREITLRFGEEVLRALVTGTQRLEGAFAVECGASGAEPSAEAYWSFLDGVMGENVLDHGGAPSFLTLNVVRARSTFSSSEPRASLSPSGSGACPTCSTTPQMDSALLEVQARRQLFDAMHGRPEGAGPHQA